MMFKSNVYCILEIKQDQNPSSSNKTLSDQFLLRTPALSSFSHYGQEINQTMIAQEISSGWKEKHEPR